MKAIKLASMFAVSAVAAAVSTTTFAAEAVFTGTAGLEYQSSKDNRGKQDFTSSMGELNIAVDTGVVYVRMDMNTDKTKANYGSFVIDEAYVTQGAVQFGDFDGTLVDSAAFSAGVEEDKDDAKQDFGDELGVRYSVMDGLTVAIESVDGSNKGAFAASYITTLGSSLSLGISGGFNKAEKKNQIVTLGGKLQLGMATLTAFAQTGKANDLKVTNTGFGVDLGLTEQLSLAAQYYNQTGEASPTTDLKDKGITEFTAYYTVGDIKYYASYVDYELKKADYSVVGAKASF